MTRTVPGSGAVIEPIFNSTFGIKDVFVNDGGTGYVAGDPPELKVGNCGTPLREAILEPVITNGQIAAVKVLDPGEGYDPLRIAPEKNAKESVWWLRRVTARIALASSFGFQ